ncbi:MAG: alpha/beta hydrolase [Thermoleophilaceae bacterium]|nr:alpha/beta hydrolase [Thermoleophilaceae bacterium]
MSNALLQPMPEVPGVEHIYVNAGGLRMHVAVAGPEDGEPVMLLHGWPQHWWLWRNVIPGLAAAGYRVYAPDTRGFGWSEATNKFADYDKRNLARDFIALLDALGIEKVRLAGHDWGGFAGFLVAMIAPERVDRFMAFNITPPWLDPRPFKLFPALKALSRLGYQVILSTPGLSRAAQAGPLRPVFRSGVIKGSNHQEIWGDGAVDTYLNQFLAPQRSTATKFLYRNFLMKELPLIQFNKYMPVKLTTRTQIIFGLDDVAIDSDVITSDLHSEFATDLSVETVEGYGHFIVDERPELATAKLLEFFA